MAPRCPCFLRQDALTAVPVAISRNALVLPLQNEPKCSPGCCAAAQRPLRPDNLRLSSAFVLTAIPIIIPRLDRYSGRNFTERAGSSSAERAPGVAPVAALRLSALCDPTT
jgi:hypothetical protein